MVEYIKALWGWPTVTLILMLYFRKEIRQLVNMIYRGIEAKLGDVSLTIPPISVEEQKTGPGLRTANVSTQPDITAGLTKLQTNILQEFIKRGDYDTLDVSRTLIQDFRQLKNQGLLRWEREEDKGKQVSLSEFGVTEEGKNKV